MARYSNEKVLISRKKILDSASKLFRGKGYEGTGINEIMAAANLTKGTFYSHFRSKRDLLNHVILYAIDKRKGLLKGSNEYEQAVNLINGYLSLEHLKSLETWCLMPRLSGDLRDHRSFNSKCVDRYVKEFSFVFEKVVSKEDASFLSSTLVGGLIMARTLKIKEASSFIENVRNKCLKYLEERCYRKKN